jgi:hypothetical protein
MNKIALFFCFAFSLFAERTDILFHLHDAGETYALLPVIRQLEVDYLILSTGVAGELAVKNGILQDKIRSLEDLNQIEPREVVTGVAHASQGETLDLFNAKGIPTFAYWDNFNAEGELPYFQTAHAVEPRAKMLLLPCQALASAFSHRATQVVGQPTLDAPVPTKVALWIGGYGKDYEAALELFQKGKEKIEGVTFLMQHHPKTGLKNDLKLSEALSIADLVICHQSTAAFQALAANKPVLHVIPQGQVFNSLPLQIGLARKVTSADDFPDAVREAMEMKIDGFFELMGIPENSTTSCKTALMEPIQ